MVHKSPCSRGLVYMPPTKSNPSSPKEVSARLQALWWLVAVSKDGRSVNDLLANHETYLVSTGEVAFAKQLLFGSLRYFHQMTAILDQLLKKPLKQKDTDIFAILILGVYQLRYLSVPDHAALSQSVELTRKVNKSWASGFVNGVLRNYQRQTKEIDEKLAQAKTYRYSHPNWIINQLESDWPANAAAILDANNQRAPMTLRVNQQKIGIEDYQQELVAEGLSSTKHPIAIDALILDTPCDVGKLPGFAAGLVTLQDAAAQLTVELMDLQDGQRVLDGCASPGGKTTHILQRTKGVHLTSVEMSKQRMVKIEQTLQRLGMHSNLYCADILDTDSWWDGELFDRILIDVPCSASGVIRRNPDIKIHRKKLDLAKLVSLQADILNSCWELLKPGGRLVYATCSVFKSENEQQIEKFLAKQQAETVLFPATIHSALTGTQMSKLDLVNACSIGYQIFPGEENMDGFYLCGLEKDKIS